MQAALSNDSPNQLALLQTEYERLFTDIGTPAVVPLYEAGHLEERPRIRNESALSMCSRLTNAGLDIPLNSSEPPDHLSIELEYLYHRLATGWSEANPEIESRPGSSPAAPCSRGCAVYAETSRSSVRTPSIWALPT